MQKCIHCGGPSVGEECPRCLREMRPDLTGVIHPHEVASTKAGRSAVSPPASTATAKKPGKPSSLLRVPDKPKPTPIGYAAEESTLTPPPTFSRLVSTKLSEEQYQAAQRIIDANPDQFPSWYAFVRAGVAMLLQAMEEE